MNLVNLLALIIPVFLGWIFIRRFKARLNSHDPKVMVNSFILAIIPVIPAMVIKYTASEFRFDENTLDTLFGKIGYGLFLGVLFELLKYMVIVAYSFRQREFDEPLAGILITLMIGLGFTFGENAWYILSGSEFYSGTWRLLISIPAALACATTMGFYAGLSKYGFDTDDVGSFGLRMRGLGTAILFQSFYNFFLNMKEYKDLVGLIVIGTIAISGLLTWNIFRARRLHTRLIYSRKRREKTWGLS
jgi:RsiW-degrading membrane proteinase PrsW (M82 family)